MVANEIDKFKVQVNQYNALLKQVLEMTDQPSVEFVYTDDSAKNVMDAVMTWLESMQTAKQSTTTVRDEALQTLRTVDILDDEALKGAALLLTEAETRLVTLEGVEHRWGRIVRHTAKSSAISEHTREWFVRFWRQWSKTNHIIEDRIRQFKKIIKTIPDI